MATDFNQVSQELAQDMELLRGSIQRGSSGVDQLGGISQSAASKLKSFGQGLDATTSTFLKSIYDGSDALDVLAASTKQAGNSTSDLVSKFGLVGEVLGFFIKRTTDLAAKGFEDLNKIFRGYAQISRQGATGAKGITAFYEQATKMGYGVEQLNEFAQLIGQNTQTLSLFGNGMVNAFDQIAKVSEAFTSEGIRGDMLAMGMRLEDINGGIMKYARILTITGRQESMTQEQLKKGAQSYIMELDRLSKLTGKNADTIQAEREARLQDERLLAAELISREEEARLRKINTAESVAQADFIARQRDAQQSILDTLPKSLSTAVGALFNDIITDKQLGALMQIMPETVRYIQSGGRDMIEFNRSMRQELQQFVSQGGIGSSAALVRQFGEAFGGLEFRDIVDMLQGTKRVTKDTVTTAETNQRIMDETTNSIARLNDVFILGKQTMQAFLTDGVKPVTRAFEYMVNKIEGFVAPGTLPRPPFNAPLPPGVGPGQPTRLPGTAVPVTEGGSPAGTTPPGEAETVAPPAAPAAPAAPSAPAAPASGPGPGTAAGPGTQRSLFDIFNFGSQTGSAANFQQLEGSFRDRVIAAAEQYNKLTGNKIQINSAFRTREDQQRLYNSGTVGPDGKRYINGRPVAPPGNSDHERGVAIDIQNFNDPIAVRSMNEAGLFQRVANDNVHFSARFGRLTSGPLSGYRATLHGNEVVIPLSNGTTIPLDMTPLIRNLDSNAQAIAAQIERLDDLIMLSRDTLNVNRKMLSYRS